MARTRSGVHRTYKTGTRVPGSLVDPIAAAMREREMLNFLLEHPGWCTFDHFMLHDWKHLRLGEESTREYRDLFEALKSCPPAALLEMLQENAARFISFTRHDPAYRECTYTKGALPRIVDPAYPSFTEVSKHDYQLLAANSLEFICRTIDLIAREVVPLLPAGMDELYRVARERARSAGSKISDAGLRRRVEKQVMFFLGKGHASNLEQVAYKQIHAMMEAHATELDKVNVVRELLVTPPGPGETRPDFSDAVAVLARHEFVPGHLLSHLAWRWDVDRRWVRNKLVGWRRAIDDLFPVAFQVTSLKHFFSSLAAFVKPCARTVEQEHVIGVLQRCNVLHLLGVDGVDLSPLVKEDLRPALRALDATFPGWNEDARALIDAHSTRIDAGTFERAARLLSLRVKETIKRKGPGSAAASNCRTFLRKVELVAGLGEVLQPFLDRHVAGTTYTKSIAKLLSSMEVVRESGMTSLRSTLRGIAAIACEALHPETREILLSAMADPEKCVTRPYMSSNRKHAMIPLELHLNKYIVVRKEHPWSFKIDYDENKKKHVIRERFATGKDMTRLMSAGEPVWLGVPIYTPDQFDDTRGIRDQRRHDRYWLQVIPTKKIIECLRHGAAVKLLRLNPPRGPARKIIVDVILEAKDREPFRHRTRFIKAMDRRYSAKPLPRSGFLNIDFNTKGENVIAVGTDTSRVDLTAASGHDMMEGFVHFDEKIDTLLEGRKHLQAAIDRSEGKSGRENKNHRRVVEQHLVNRRVGTIHAQQDREVVLHYAYITYRTGATHVGWDGIDVNTRGTRGTLARAVTYMPKQKGLYRYFVDLCGDLSAEHVLTGLEGIHVTSPYTSQVCDECLARDGVARRTRDQSTPYHVFKCTACGSEGNRHQVSARVGALLLKRNIEEGESMNA
jgi:hypothetical protein